MAPTSLEKIAAEAVRTRKFVGFARFKHFRAGGHKRNSRNFAEDLNHCETKPMSPFAAFLKLYKGQPIMDLPNGHKHSIATYAGLSAKVYSKLTPAQFAECVEYGQKNPCPMGKIHESILTRARVLRVPLKLVRTNWHKLSPRICVWARLRRIARANNIKTRPMTPPAVREYEEMLKQTSLRRAQNVKKSRGMFIRSLKDARKILAKVDGQLPADFSIFKAKGIDAYGNPLPPVAQPKNIAVKKANAGAAKKANAKKKNSKNKK